MIVVACLLVVGFFFAIKVLDLFGEGNSKSEESVKEESVTKEGFIEKIAPYAQELGQAYGVKPSIILSQAILESDFGQSKLAKKYKNLFGVKAYGNAPKVSLDTKEFVDEKWITIKGEFRVYATWNESMDDHTKLFVEGVDWNPELYKEVFTSKDYKEAAKAVQDAGYATDPDYAEKLIHVIEQYHLDKYDS